LRSVNFLLKELERWEAAGIVTREQASTLRQRYEQRRSNLRAQFAHAHGDPANVGDATQTAPVSEPAAEAQAGPAQAHPPTNAGSSASGDARWSASSDAGSSSRTRRAVHRRDSFDAPPQPLREPRTLLETLSDPHNLRLLLYTGAAMIVVSVVLWLRDVLYLKLQEPLVQAGLLALATLAFMGCGWYAILRTRQKLTGRALTLVGSLLVPINFWFLVRSGLIANNGRAWMVCALCALLYAHTALLLREKLYVYLAAAGSIATAWALVFRFEREAYGLYALTLMLASLLFLHLSRLFPLDAAAGPMAADDEGEATAGERRALEDERRAAAAGSARGERRSSTINGPTFKTGRWSYELWSVPLIRVGLIGAALSALLYMPLRLGPTFSLYDGLFHLGTSRYDTSIAMLLFLAWAYALWFTGRSIYTDRRVLAFTLCALLLCWTELLALDGLRFYASTNLLALSATAMAMALAHRLAREVANSLALYLASVTVSILLLPVAFVILVNATALTTTHSASIAFLAASFALLSATRRSDKFAQFIFTYCSALLATAAFLLALESAALRVETIYAACAAWPFALYLCAWLLRATHRTATRGAVRAGGGCFVRAVAGVVWGRRGPASSGPERCRVMARAALLRAAGGEPVRGHARRARAVEFRRGPRFARITGPGRKLLG
jgi:hypothetical protein